MKLEARDPEVNGKEWILALFLGAFICGVYWWKVVAGGGLVGGDTYPYFMPQKMVLAEAFREGRLPLWHHLTGLGYPLHAESQAGVFYPTNQVLYRVFDFHRAYHVSLLLHYWLAFVFTWRFARCQKLGNAGALLAAVVFVYGWFPARVSLEWSMIGGLWLPLSLWLTDRLLVAPSPRRWAVLSLCLAIHLLAGHFALAFINQLALVMYSLLRPGLPAASRRGRIRAVGLTGLAIAAGLLTASVQLLPTLELKQISQRQNVSGSTETSQAFDPAYGHLPPLYVSQLLASWWYWHTPELRDAGTMKSTPGALAGDTNTVEAHLYWGLIPFVLVGLSVRRKFRLSDGRFVTLWLVIGIFGLVYATGWPLMLTRFLPGFSFFMGPGRYTILTALAGGLLAGFVWDQLLLRRRTVARLVLTAIVTCVTLVDLSWSSTTIAHAVVVQTPPMAQLEKSWLRAFFETRPHARLLAPGPNVCNLLGVSCVPQYLGIGPAVYFSEQLHPERRLPAAGESWPSDTEAQQLRDLGITHVLTLEAVEQTTDQVQLRSAFPDSFLNAVWARGSQPVWLYEVVNPAGRISVDGPQRMTGVQVLQQGPQQIEFDVTITEPAKVVLKELMYPGWTVSVDGKRMRGFSNGLSMRSVQVPGGQHRVRWTFTSASSRVGAIVSILSIVLLTLALFCRSAKNSADG